MAESDSIAQPQSSNIDPVQDNNEDKNQSGTSVNNNISASGGNWVEVNKTEAKAEPPNDNSADNNADEIEDLLSMTVSKDYINCVWTSVPDGDPKNPSALEKPVAEDPPLNETESSTQTEKLDSTKAPEEQPGATPSPAIIRRKRKRKSKKKTPTKEDGDKEGLTIVEVTKTPNELQINIPGETSTKSSNQLQIKVPCELPVKKQMESKLKKKAIKTLQEVADPECAEKKEKLFSAFKNFYVNRPVPMYTLARSSVLLNPQKPNPAFFTDKSYTCKGCGDKFVLESSLAGHIARKIARLLYKCPVCEDRLTFDNRCAFLEHVHSHKMLPDYVNPEDLYVLPLEDEESECASLFKQSSLSLVLCPVCSEMVESLQSHFEGTNAGGPAVTKISDTLICDLCGYVSPSKCAAAAHEKFHKGEPAFSCPDCGETFLNSSSLSNHLHKVCFHHLKKTVFKCSHCNAGGQSIDEFFEHLTTEHVRPMYRCHVCEVSHVSYEDFNSHRVTEHNLAKQDVVSASSCMVTECDLCPGAPICSSSVEDHASVHTTQLDNMQTVFQCNQCQSIFESKTLMSEHLPCSESFRDSVCNDSVVEDNLCEPFQPMDTSQDKSPKKMSPPSENVLNSKRLCTEDDIKMETTDIPPANEIIPKEECRENVIEKEDVPVASTNEKPLKKSVVCKICRMVVSAEPNKALIKRHFSSEHFDIYMNAIHKEVNGQLTHPAENYVMKSDKEIVDEFLNSFTNNSNGSRVNSKKRNVKKNNTAKVNAAGKFGIKAPKSVPVSNVKKCYKCSFTSKYVRAFRSHIILHRSNSSELQCPECGLCFIVRPPLEKHLIAKHGIKNVAKYLSENGFEDHESEVELSDNENQIVNVESDSEVLLENQCKVCKQVFQSAMLLEKHFRVHGGAFLLANLKAKRSAL